MPKTLLLLTRQDRNPVDGEFVKYAFGVGYSASGKTDEAGQNFKKALSDLEVAIKLNPVRNDSLKTKIGEIESRIGEN